MVSISGRKFFATTNKLDQEKFSLDSTKSLSEDSHLISSQVSSHERHCSKYRKYITYSELETSFPRSRTGLHFYVTTRYKIQDFLCGHSIMPNEYKDVCLFFKIISEFDLSPGLHLFLCASISVYNG